MRAFPADEFRTGIVPASPPFCSAVSTAFASTLYDQTYPENHHQHGRRHGRQQICRISNSEVINPRDRLRGHSGYGQTSHSSHDTEGTITKRDLRHGNERLPCDNSLPLVDLGQLSPCHLSILLVAVARSLDHSRANWVGLFLDVPHLGSHTSGIHDWLQQK